MSKNTTHTNKTTLINQKLLEENINLKAKISQLELINNSKLQEQESQLISNIINKLFDAIDLYTIAFQIVKIIADYLDTDDCVIYEVVVSENHLKQIAASGDKVSKNGQIVNKLCIPLGDGVVGHVAKTGISELIYDTRKDKRYILDLEQRNSEIAVPILLDGKVIAVIDSEHPDKNHYTTTHLRAIETVSKIIALKIKNAIILRDKKQYEYKILKSEQRLSSLILNLDTAILLEDENRKIVYTNKKFCDLFSINALPDQLIGADCTNAADQSKHLFTNPQDFISRIKRLLLNKQKVLGDELILCDGTTLERDYIPIFDDNNYQGHLWAYKDVTLKKEYNKSLELQKNELSAIINNMNLGLMEVDNNDVILMVNKSFCEMSGYTKKELIGKKARQLLLNEKEKDKILIKTQKRNHGVSDSYELKINTKNGVERHWLISGAPNYNLKGKVIGSIGVHLDITNFKHLQKQKEQLLDKLKKSNDELQDYAHIVSHDLKSPLRNIHALTSWIKADNKDTLNQSSYDYLNQLELTLEKMEVLISRVLQHASIRETTADNTTTDLQKMIEGLMPTIHIPSHIKIHIKKKLPLVKGDMIKLQQVFLNLINNAVEHIDKQKGYIEIDYKTHKNKYEFSISDNGEGIDKKIQNQVFKMFHTFKKQKSNSGIGLSIVKKILDIYNCKISIKSKKNVGTTFYFTLKK